MLDTITPVHADQATRPSALRADGVARVYGEGDAAVHALCGVTLDVPAGQFTAIMGPSGSGKSTLMHLLAGLDRPTEGTVEIGGEDIGSLNDRQLTKLRRKHVGFVFQAFNLLPVLSADENVTLPLSIAGRKVDREALDDFSHVTAAVSVSGKGVMGRFVAKAVEGLLAGGALDSALGRIAQGVENAQTDGFALAA